MPYPIIGVMGLWTVIKSWQLMQDIKQRTVKQGIGKLKNETLIRPRVVCL
jgi:hypothetical protein